MIIKQNGAPLRAPRVGYCRFLLLAGQHFRKKRSANRQLFLDNARRNENQQFGFVLLLRGLLEEQADEWNIA